MKGGLPFPPSSPPPLGRKGERGWRMGGMLTIPSAAFVFEKATRRELAGAFGDLGELIPPLVALARVNGLHVPTALLWNGVWNILTSLVYAVPIPVQPMHTITAVTLAERLPLSHAAAAGMFVSACTLFLAATRLIRVFTHLQPKGVIRGLQLGVAIKVAAVAYSLLQGAEKWEWGLAGAALALQLSDLPVGGAVFAVGIAVGMGRAWGNLCEGYHFPVTVSRIDHAGIVEAGIPQLPMTLLNSIVATADLAAVLFSGCDVQLPSTTRLCATVGVMNLSSCWLGHFPSCHGSGGLAAQYALGARTQVSMLLVGVVKVVTALTLSSCTTAVLASFPSGILAFLLFTGAIHLASSIRDLASKDDAILAACTACGIVATRSTAVGFLFGLGCATAKVLVAGMAKGDFMTRLAEVRVVLRGVYPEVFCGTTGLAPAPLEEVELSDGSPSQDNESSL
eukprot:Sspe_Gene.43719::Locus_21353_Transcript_1_1_Confidence_1.000_Length_2658::g.43719::m.43719